MSSHLKKHVLCIASLDNSELNDNGWCLGEDMMTLIHPCIYTKYKQIYDSDRKWSMPTNTVKQVPNILKQK